MRGFRNRQQAGRMLAEALRHYAGRSDVIVLGLPRGGVPPAAEVARTLDADLDVLIVRKLGHPQQPELAIGAICGGGIRVLNESIQVPERVFEELTRREEAELRRREEDYRENRPFPILKDRVVILVDDGLATGATMRAAVAAVRQMNPSQIVVAVPVAPPDTVSALQREADEVVCLIAPRSFFGVGQFYEDFSQTDDETVRTILRSNWEHGDHRTASRPT